MRQFITLLFTLLLGSATAQAQPTLPRHHAYTWSGFSLDDLKGNICVPVIFVNFTDSNNDNETAVSSANQKTWLTRLNTSNSTNHMGADGSVNDYFLAQSYGATNVTFESIGTYTASGKAASYASNSANLTKRAITSIEDVDWSRYDSNGDGEVDCILLIYAGHCDGDDNSQRQIVTSIYPHHDWLERSYGSRVSLTGGLRAQNYVWANNLRNGSSTGIAATSTVCHELTHGIFDLPDYYKNLTSYLGQYDPMCYGYRQMNYGAANDHCCNFSSFNRMYLGWLTPYVLTAPCHVRLRPLSEAPESCVVFDPADDRHFFLLENRQAITTTWDAHLPASGLIVTEVHFSQSHFDNHSLNGGTVKDVQLVVGADNSRLAIPNASYYDYDQTAIPFGLKGRNALNGRVDAVFKEQPVTNITQNTDGSIEFDFMGGGTTVDLTGIQSPHLQTSQPPHLPTSLDGRTWSSSIGHTPIVIAGGRKTLLLK